MANKAAQVGALKINSLFSVKGISDGLAKARAQIGGFVGSIGKMGLAAAGIGAGLGVAAVGAGVLSTALDIEDQVVGLGKAVGLSGAELQGFRDELVDMGTELRGVRTSELIEIATAGAKIGVGADQLGAYTKNIAMLSTAFDDMPVGEISDGMGILTNMFGLEAADGALKLGSAIDALADSAATNGADLINTMQRLGGSANLLGLAADESAALSTALLDTGTSAEKAGGALNRTFIAIADASRSADFAKLLGVSQADFQRMLVDSPMQAVEGFLRALKGKNLTEVGSLLGSVGITSGEDVAELAKLGIQVDKLGGFLRTANAEFLTGARAQESYAASSDTTRARLDQLWNILDKISLTIGDKILPPLNDFLDRSLPRISEMADGFSGVSEKVSFLGDAIAYLKFPLLGIVALFKTAAALILGGISEIVEGINAIPGVNIDKDGIIDRTARQAIENAEKAQKAANEAMKVWTDPSLLPSAQIKKVAEKIEKNLVVTPKVAPAVSALPTAVAPAVASAATSAPSLAGSAELGSADAFRAISEFRSGGQRDGTAKSSAKTADNTTQANVLLTNIGRKLDKLGGAVLTALPI